MSTEPTTVNSMTSLPDPFTSPAYAIDHVAIAVRDPDEAVGWYRRNFGMAVVNDEIIQEGLNVRLIFLSTSPELNACTLQLISPIGDGPVSDYLNEHGEGLHHLCLAVPDITEALTTLGESITQIFRGGFGLPCAFLREAAPAGARIELVERLPTS